MILYFLVLLMFFPCVSTAGVVVPLPVGNAQAELRERLQGANDEIIDLMDLRNDITHRHGIVVGEQIAMLGPAMGELFESRLIRVFEGRPELPGLLHRLRTFMAQFDQQ